MAGDPGIGSFLKKAVGGVARIGASLLPGPVGAIARAGGTALSRIGGGAAIAAVAAPAAAIIGGGLASRGVLQGGRQLARNVGEFAGSVLTGEACPKGFHLNKSGYYTQREGWIDPRTKCVRNRSRNPANGRALRRAVGRVQSFNSIVKRSRKSLRALSSI